MALCYWSTSPSILLGERRYKRQLKIGHVPLWIESNLKKVDCIYIIYYYYHRFSKMWSCSYMYLIICILQLSAVSFKKEIHCKEIFVIFKKIRNMWWKNLGILVVQRILTTEDRHDRRETLCLVNSFLIKNVKLKTEIYIYMYVYYIYVYYSWQNSWFESVGHFWVNPWVHGCDNFEIPRATLITWFNTKRGWTVEVTMTKMNKWMNGINLGIAGHSS